MKYLGAGQAEHERHLYTISDGDYDERFEAVLLDFAQDILGNQFLDSDEVLLVMHEDGKIGIYEDGDPIPFITEAPTGWYASLVHMLLQENVYFSPVRNEEAS